MDAAELYNEIMAKHYKRPAKRGQPGAQVYQAEVHNRVCGDKVHLAFDVTADKTLSNVYLATEGCMICKCSASLMSDWLNEHGLTKENPYPEVIVKLLNGKEVDELPASSELHALKSLAQFPARHNCATLPWKALEAALLDMKKRL